MTISLIVAASSNGVIGDGGQLPWHLPDDLRNFKRLTTGKAVIMGRKTHESIGRPLPERRNIVMTRSEGYIADGCEVVTSADAAIALVGDVEEAMVIGGGEIYLAFLPVADRVYLTRVHAEIEGDTRFPPLEDAAWQLVSTQSHAADAEHAYAFDFLEFERA